MMNTMRNRTTARAFTLIELLIVVAIISILASIAVVNLRRATERALKSSDAANLRMIATALQNYFVDYGKLPPGDREAGPFPSHTVQFSAVGNGPAAGGSWDGLPWLLVERGYITDSSKMFTPKYLKRYQGGTTIRGGHPRHHNFRYAYNSAALSSGGHAGGQGNIMSGEVWLVRNLFVAPQSGWYGGAWPNYPADYEFPWGEGDQEGKLEHAMYADFAVRTVVGGTNKAPETDGW
jgi:prepilin-type N-terminal cleavage/methylation domain-containing protein